MYIVVCVKMVPDTTQVKIDPETNTLVREGVPFITNPFDTHAVEEGLRLKDRLISFVMDFAKDKPVISGILISRKTRSMDSELMILNAS